MQAKDVIAKLNYLIETCKDGEAGFGICAENLDDAQLKQTFAARAEECANAAHELQALVRALGGVAESTSSIGGMLHRRWVDLKSLVSERDKLAVLAECERGEDIAVDRYRAVLEQDLPADVRAVVERQFQGVQKNHDQVRHLRASVEAAANLTR